MDVFNKLQRQYDNRLPEDYDYETSCCEKCNHNQFNWCLKNDAVIRRIIKDCNYFDSKEK